MRNAVLQTYLALLISTAQTVRSISRITLAPYINFNSTFHPYQQNHLHQHLLRYWTAGSLLRSARGMSILSLSLSLGTSANGVP
jgi:hypothetical protein